jgi:hypothetical protein
MPTIQQISIYAQTAVASYATNLIPLINNTANFKATNTGMADAQAIAFDKDWAVLQQSEPNANGFSAVLLQRKDAIGNVTGGKVLAIAGTDKSSAADVITDLVNVVWYGTVLGMPQYGSLESFCTELVSSGKLDAMRHLFGLTSITATGNRADFYNNVKQFADVSVSLQGKGALSLAPSATLVSFALVQVGDATADARNVDTLAANEGVFLCVA